MLAGTYSDQEFPNQKFFHLEDKDVEQASTKYYLSYVYNITYLYKFICNLYANTLFETDWWITDEIRNIEIVNMSNKEKKPVNKCEFFIYFTQIYTKSLLAEERVRPTFEWKDKEKGKRVIEKIDTIYAPDCTVWNYAINRWYAYKDYYRPNRPTIIKYLKDALTSKPDDFKQDVFDWMVNSLDDVPLSMDRPSEAYIKNPNKKSNILKDFIENQRKYLDAIASATGNIYMYPDVEPTLAVYVDCRQNAFKIFNLLTEIHSPYEKHLKPFISAKGTKSMYVELLNAINKRHFNWQFTDPKKDVDNFWQVYDQWSWEARGVKESLYSLFVDHNKYDKGKIKSIEGCDSKMYQCDIRFDGASVYSKKRFQPGDVVEVCPTKPIPLNALYSKDVRDLAFQVAQDNKFVIPFGYCEYYDVPVGNLEANCAFEWNESDNTITIRATKVIPANTVLVLDINAK